MPKSIIETKPDSSLSIVDVVDELSHCQDELASAPCVAKWFHVKLPR